MVNIGIEGMMILGTFGAGYAGYQWGPWAGVVLRRRLRRCSADCCTRWSPSPFGVDHIISGVAINILAPGLTLYLSRLLFTDAPGGGQRQSPPVPDVGRITLPWLSDWLGEIEDKDWFFVSDLAGILRGLITNLSLLTVLAVLLIVGTGFVLWRTRFGLRLRSVGEAPYAAESLGVNVYRYKYIAVIDLRRRWPGWPARSWWSGLKFQDGQTGGRGFIGLAAMIFGNWRPGGMAMGAVAVRLHRRRAAVRLVRRRPCTRFLLLVALALVVVAVAAVPGRAPDRGRGRRRRSRCCACGGSSPPTPCPSNWSRPRRTRSPCW